MTLLVTNARQLVEPKLEFKLKIQRDIFQKDSLLFLLSIIAMMSFNHILRKCKRGCGLVEFYNISTLVYCLIQVLFIYIYIYIYARGVMVIIVGNGHGDASSILEDADCISHSANTLVKGMNPIILPQAMSK